MPILDNIHPFFSSANAVKWLIKMISFFHQRLAL